MSVKNDSKIHVLRGLHDKQPEEISHNQVISWIIAALITILGIFGTYTINSIDDRMRDISSDVKDMHTDLGQTKIDVGQIKEDMRLMFGKRIDP